MAENKQKVPTIKAQIERIIDDPNSRTKAFASATIGGAFAVHSMRVVESSKGLFVAMPNRSFQNKNGETAYVDYFHAITKDAFNELSNAVLTEYQNELNQAETDDVEIIDEDSENFEQSM